MSQNPDARLLPDSVTIGRLSWCCSTRTIGDLRLIPDEIVARLAYERAHLQPWPYLGQERYRRCRGLLRCLLLVILPAAMTAADLCMGRGHCAEEEQQRRPQPTPRETRPCGVAWWSARLNAQVQFTRPGGIDYINPAHDPRKKQPRSRLLFRLGQTIHSLHVRRRAGASAGPAKHPRAGRDGRVEPGHDGLEISCV